MHFWGRIDTWGLQHFLAKLRHHRTVDPKPQRRLGARDKHSDRTDWAAPSACRLDAAGLSHAPASLRIATVAPIFLYVHAVQPSPPACRVLVHTISHTRIRGA